MWIKKVLLVLVNKFGAWIKTNFRTTKEVTDMKVWKFLIAIAVSVFDKTSADCQQINYLGTSFIDDTGKFQENRALKFLVCNNSNYEELRTNLVYLNSNNTIIIRAISIRNSTLNTVDKELFLYPKARLIYFLFFEWDAISYFHPNLLEAFDFLRFVMIKNCDIHVMDLGIFFLHSSLRRFHLIESNIHKYVDHRLLNNTANIGNKTSVEWIHFYRMNITGLSFLSKYFYSKIYRIELMGNKLTEFDINMFSKAESSLKLNLSDNKIKVVRSNKSKCKTDLKLLDLSRNSIDSIEKGAFAGLQILNFSLDEAFGKITTVTQEMFSGLKVDNAFSMTGNNITTLEPFSFHHLNRLKTLELQFNKINRISEDTFAGLYYLQTLNLSYNQIISLPAFIFKDLRKIKVLHLQFNNIYMIDNSSLSCLNALRVLDLSYNYVDSIVLSFSTPVFVRLFNKRLDRPSCFSSAVVTAGETSTTTEETAETLSQTNVYLDPGNMIVVVVTLCLMNIFVTVIMMYICRICRLIRSRSRNLTVVNEVEGRSSKKIAGSKSSSVGDTSSRIYTEIDYSTMAKPTKDTIISRSMPISNFAAGVNFSEVPTYFQNSEDDSYMAFSEISDTDGSRVSVAASEKQFERFKFHRFK